MPAHPIEFGYEPRTFSDPTQLEEGLHPGYLVQVVIDDVPPDWESYKKDKLQWRWYLAIWGSEAQVGQVAPELQSGISARSFSPGGKFQASKARVWSKALLRRDIGLRERFAPNELVPLPCMVYITREDKHGNRLDFANVKELRRWDRGVDLLTPALRENLMSWWHGKEAELAAQRAPEPEVEAPATFVATPAPAPAPVPPAPQTPAPATKGW